MAAGGRHIVVTGVSRGLGRAMVERFVAAGHVVAGCARDAGRIAELARRWPAPHRFAAVDVADDGQVARWAADTLDSLGHVDILVNNAALINANAPLWRVPVAEFDRVIDVNVKGTTNVLRHFVPAMVARGEGVIVNFSSGWGRSTSPDVAPYCASKWAIEGLSQALAQELPAGMVAVALNPGIIDTDMLRSCFGESAASYADTDDWARRAVPFILAITPRDNGQPLVVPSKGRSRQQAS